MIKVTQTTLAKPKVLAISTVSILVALAIFYGDKTVQDSLKFTSSHFDFSVFCPVPNPNELFGPASLATNLLKQGSTQIDTYVVYVRSMETKLASGNVSLNLTYCGLARPWLGSCDKAQLICSTPGPMFYLPVKKPINIVWVNAINSSHLQWPEEDCYDPNSSNEFCNVQSKNSKAKGTCNYQDPTFLNYNYTTTRINKNNVPINPHIHGLSVRPVFDGNPLSWFNNNGEKGVGFESLSSPNYFKQFQKVDSFSTLPGITLGKNIKIVRIENDQPAGNLFYHDHSMRSTKFNVKYGLVGLYILYDPKIEVLLPQGNYQKFIFFSSTLYDDLRTSPAAPAPTPTPTPTPSVTPSPSPTTPTPSASTSTFSFPFPSASVSQFFSHSGHSSTSNSLRIDIKSQITSSEQIFSHGMNRDHHKQKLYVMNQDHIIERGPTYRFKMLNNHFDNVYENISFAAYYTNVSNKITELNALDPNFDLDQNKTIIPFTLIGVDSTVFHKPIKGMTQFNLGEAERVQLLIQFDPANQVPHEVNNVYLICFDQNVGGTVMKFNFQLHKTNKPIISHNIEALHHSITALNNPFTDLSTVQPSSIAVKRVKPLFSRPSDQNFIINGHHMYGMGASDLPQIGTTEDWYLVNNLQESHPIHVHLINFQVTQKFTLKLFSDGCTFYELDFYRSSGYTPFQNLTNQQLCDYLNTNITQQEAQMLYHYLSDFNSENVTRVDPELGRMTGFNVMQKISTPSDQAVYDVSASADCSFNKIYKYICSDASNSIPPHYKRWKDTALVHGYSVSVIRIRWTKTEYDPAVQQYPFFNIPQEHLIEFPGYLYHCHILPHEDNEMMRPIMLQPSDTYVKNATQRVQVQGSKKVPLNWTQKVAQINSNSGCK